MTTTLSDPNLGTAKSEGLTAPLPVIGLRGEFEMTDRITLRGVTQVFNIEVDNVAGHLRDSYVGVDYSFSERFAVGLAYNDVAMRFPPRSPTIEVSSTGATTER
jgi:hypothetical protein